MTNEIEQGLYEKLCAYVLGEADDEERAEVEKALEASAELRAERERIEKTIGLVRETLSVEESLPTDIAGEILADARALRRRPWYMSTSFRAAAGIAAITLVGVLGYRASRSQEVSPMAQPFAGSPRQLQGKELLASNEPNDGRGASLGQLAFEKKGEVPAPPSASEANPAAKLAESMTASAVQSGKPVIDSAVLDRIDSLGYSGSTTGEEQVGAVIDRSQAYSGNPEHAYSGGSEHAVVRGMGRAMPGAIGVGGSGAGPSSAAPQSAGQAFEPNQSLGVGDSTYRWREQPLTASDSKYEAMRGLMNGLGYVGEKRDAPEGPITGNDDDSFRFGADETSVRAKLRELEPVARERWIEDECSRILRRCRRLPSEKPRDMFFRFYGDNPFEFASLDPLSTFSVDVDTASYALARRYLNEGHIPQKAQVRTEEFVNSFKADVPSPKEGVFAIHTDLAPSRFDAEKTRWMLRVVVSGREVTKVERKPLNLTFVIDVSGSMREQDRLGMVKHAIRLLVDELGGGDNIALVAFSTDARVALPMTSVRNRSAIESALHPLQPENSTNSEAGLKLGYSIALANLNPEAQNRVVFLSDGVANVGETDPGRISEGVRPIREKGVYLNTIGVGMNNHNDVLLEQLADKGDGICNYIDTPDEARKVIVEGFTGAFETIARDVKVQVEFDPAQVQRYRLLGYENRAVADKDFRNDRIDAGEVGAGHQVTALYEIEPASGISEKPIATVRLRWKAPRSVNAPVANEEATEIAAPVLASRKTSFEGAGPGYRRAVIVAQFAELLRRSVHARGDDLSDLILEAEKLEKETRDPETGELVVLLHKSKQLILASLPSCDDVCETIEALHRNALLRCEHDALAKEGDSGYLAELEKQNTELERRIRDLLRRRLEQSTR